MPTLTNEQNKKTLKLFLLRAESTPLPLWVAEAESMLTDEEWKLYQQLLKRQRKDPVAAWVLWGLLGVFGAHRFYIGDVLIGIIYLFSFGLLGFGVLADLFLLSDKIRNYNTTKQAQILRQILSARLQTATNSKRLY